MNIGKTNKCNLREDETSAEVVKKYQTFYDKIFSGYWAIYSCQFEVFYINFIKEIVKLYILAHCGSETHFKGMQI